MTENVYAIYEDDESDLECELANLTELLNLYKLRLKLLQAKDKNLELVVKKEKTYMITMKCTLKTRFKSLKMTLQS